MPEGTWYNLEATEISVFYILVLSLDCLCWMHNQGSSVSSEGDEN